MRDNEKPSDPTALIALLAFIAVMFLIYRVTGCAETGAPMLRKF